jgi:hypothetical protein
MNLRIKDYFRRMVGLPDSFGLYHSTEKLKAVRPYILKMRLEAMSKYSDAVCRYMVKVNSPQIIQQVYDELYPPLDKEIQALKANMNTTAIGNLAYVALHCQDTETRVIVTTFLVNNL